MLSVEVTETTANTATVVVAGVLDLGTGDRLLKELSRHVDRGRVRLTVDASGITWCDSSGLGALLRARTRAINVAGALTLVRVSPELHRMLLLSGMERLFGVPGRAGSR